MLVLQYEVLLEKHRYTLYSMVLPSPPPFKQKHQGKYQNWIDVQVYLNLINFEATTVIYSQGHHNGGCTEQKQSVGGTRGSKWRNGNNNYYRQPTRESLSSVHPPLHIEVKQTYVL
jgi:hypothetical protein